MNSIMMKALLNGFIVAIIYMIAHLGVVELFSYMSNSGNSVMMFTVFWGVLIFLFSTRAFYVSMKDKQEKSNE